MAITQLLVLPYLVLPSAADPNVTSHLRGVAKDGVSVTSGLTNLSMPIATLDLAVSDWTAWFSDEDQGSASCNGLISGMECSGWYCDSIRLQCDYSLGMDHGASYQTSWFTDGDTANMKCNSGEFVTAIQCSGSFCDNMRLTCTSVPSTRQSNCRELAWFSDESGPQAFTEGTRLVGLECRGSFCDDLLPYVCDVSQYCIAAGKQSGSWMWVEAIANSGVKQYSYHSTERNTQSSSSEWSESLTVSVSEGFTYSGVSGSVEVSSAAARTQARSLETALQEGYAETQTYDISPETVGMGLWQFEFTATDTCQHTEKIKTHEFIYTKGRFQSPCCLPGYAMGVYPPESYTCYQKEFQVETASHCNSCGEEGAVAACSDL